MSSETNCPAQLSHGTGEDTRAPDEDNRLVSLSQSGDLDAFEHLVSRHQKRMLNVAYRMLGDYDESCEVVQDAFVSAYKSIKDFRGQAKFATWLTSITLNLSKNRLKRLKSRQVHEAFSLDDPIETEEGKMVIDPPSKEVSTLDRMEKRDVQTRVYECIKALDPAFREVLVLRDLEDLSYGEIVSILEVREGTVKSRLFRAREMVKDCLKKVMGVF